jgi:magnesium chelatase family protein
LENKKIAVSRVKDSFIFLASFMLIATMNSCPCIRNLGYREKECVYNSYQARKYQNRIFGFLMNRIDIHVEVTALNDDSVSSASIREKL